MTDQYGRKIDYMRISITDRCNLRCRYCMPEDLPLTSHKDILTYEELLRICKSAVTLGIVNFKITGGEPLVRLGAMDFITALKEMPGVNQVTLTTNGILLGPYIDTLAKIEIDGINISLDTVSSDYYDSLTGSLPGTFDKVMNNIKKATEKGIKIKINTVLLEEAKRELTPIAALASSLPLDVRFIELMPIGEGTGMSGISMDSALHILRGTYPDLTKTDEKRGNGPATYYKSKDLLGRIGFISAVSHEFCYNCNRIRLTSLGKIKPCLCYDAGTDLRERLRDGCSDEELQELLKQAINGKPKSHCFSSMENITENHAMSEIGG